MHGYYETTCRHGSHGMIQHTHTTEYRDTWRRVLFIPRPLPAGLFRTIWKRFVNAEGCGGPRQPFNRAPHILRRARRYVVICQTGGYDV